MTILFVLLIIVACVFLGLIILVQNPKGGGLAGNVGGFSNQLMGVKQTTDVLEKGTWILAVVVAILCLLSAGFVHRGSTTQKNIPEAVKATSTQQAPAQAPAAPANGSTPAAQ